MSGVEGDSDRGNESESKESENWKVGRTCISMWDKSINRSLPLVLLQAQLPFSHCDENPCSSLTAPWTSFFFPLFPFSFPFLSVPDQTYNFMINSQKKTVGRRSKTCLDLIRRMLREEKKEKVERAAHYKRKHKYKSPGRKRSNRSFVIEKLSLFLLLRNTFLRFS